MLYFDCAASAPVLPIVIDTVKDVVQWGLANPNSVHWRGRWARENLENARCMIAECISAKPSEIAFTPSATAACQYAMDYLMIGEISPYEHKAVQAFGKGPGIAWMLANNETGELFYDRVVELATHNAVFTDATAAMGHFAVDVRDLGVVALAAGGHKFGALPGIGFVYVRGGVSDEDTYPGTPPVALALGMANAIKYRTEHIISNVESMLKNRSYLVDNLIKIPGTYINAIEKVRLPNIVSVRFDGINAKELLTLLDVNGLCASAGSACTADSDEPSKALLATGLTREEALSTIRLSFCEETPSGDFIEAVRIIRNCVARLRDINE